MPVEPVPDLSTFAAPCSRTAPATIARPRRCRGSRHWWWRLALPVPMVVAAAVASASDDSASVVRVTVVPGRTVAAPGEVIPVAIILDHDRRWNTQAGGKDADPDGIATQVTVAQAAEGLHPRLSETQWPVAERKSLRWAGPGAEVAVYSGRSIIYVPVEIRPDAPSGLAELSLRLTYQACDDRVCLAPVTGKAMSVQLAVRRTPTDAAFDHPEIFSGYRAVAPSIAGDEVSGLGGGVPIWAHVLLGVTIAVSVLTAVLAGMLGGGGVFLLRAGAVGVGLIAALIWAALAIATFARAAA